MTKADIMKALETKKVGSVLIEFKDDYDLPGRSQLYEWKKKAEAIRKKRWRDNRNLSEKSGKNPEKSDLPFTPQMIEILNVLIINLDTIIKGLETAYSAYNSKGNPKSVDLKLAITKILSQIKIIRLGGEKAGKKAPIDIEDVKSMYGARSYTVSEQSAIIGELKGILGKWKERAEAAE